MTYGYITDQNPLADPEWKNLTLTRATCKECKHNPFERIGENRYRIIQKLKVENQCPCYIADDPHYSWFPGDDWFCANFEQKRVKVYE